MSGFWSTWVMVLACVTVAISLVLFLWALRMNIPTVKDGTTGHVWAHGALREAVRPLPVCPTTLEMWMMRPLFLRSMNRRRIPLVRYHAPRDIAATAS